MPLPGTRPLRVIIADEDEAALEELRRVLEDDLGHDVVALVVSTGEAVAQIAREDPDLAFVMVHEDDEHALELISEAVELTSGPVIAHGAANGHGEDFVERAAARGVAAYTRSEDPTGLQGAIDVALRRHAEQRELGEKVEQLEDAMQRRATIERAKGILMERHGVDDDAAFELLRTHARSTRSRVAEVAQAVVGGFALDA